jgi:hypothetical protein
VEGVEGLGWEPELRGRAKGSFGISLRVLGDMGGMVSTAWHGRVKGSNGIGMGTLIWPSTGLDTRVPL